MRFDSRPSVICTASSVPKKECCHLVCHMSHPCLLSHAPSSMSTSSSSSPTNPTTQQEHSVHPITPSTCCAIAPTQTEERLMHEIFSGKSEETKNDLQRGIQTHHELGNIELYERGRMSSAIQCHSCYKTFTLEGLKFCACGMCLRPDEDTIRKTSSTM